MIVGILGFGTLGSSIASGLRGHTSVRQIVATNRRGALPPEHALFFQHSRGAALAAANVVCVIGTPLDFRLRFGRFPAETKLVHIHEDALELGRNRVPDVGISGDCETVLRQFASQKRSRSRSS